MIVLVSGCINPFGSDNSTETEQNTGPYNVGNSSFYIPESWVEVDSNVTGAVEFMRGDDTNIQIQELTRWKYNSNYANASRQRSNLNVTEETKNMSGVEVKIVRTTDEATENIYDYYFIQKDGKYYQITVWDNTRKAEARIDVDNAVTTIISTLKVEQTSQNKTNSTNKTKVNQTSNNNNNRNNDPGGDETCPRCGGSGVVPVNPNDPNTMWKSCPTCGGDGLV